MRLPGLFKPLQLLYLALALGVSQDAPAHGSVTPDADLCIIEIGYFRAHFKIYQPQTRELQDYCEDLPDTGTTLFVMEYEHAGLNDAPVDFRIVRNVTEKGRFAKLADIERITDLDAITEFHRPFSRQPDVFTVQHDFEEPGEFIGVVTVRDTATDKLHTAVFPFKAGHTGLGYWPWFVLALILLQVNYLWMSGYFQRRGKSPAKSRDGSSAHA